ncbi:cell division protein FtsQ/DivIB [Actinotalea soli]|uniref:cell division protein FtsQ/DivIB n=1 Tax=Actinotalea soli TaxID=2819234 RepID=UPI0027DDD31F|nr:cell division protein FtsQ/DivIB [Actinotalea soli]
MPQAPSREVARPGWRPVRPPVVSTGSAARFAERVALRRRLTRRRVLWSSAVLVLVAGVLGALFLSPLMALDTDEVEVRGQGTVVDADEVRAVVAAYAGTPLPRLDTVGLRRAVLDVPGVRAAEVARVWPVGLQVTVVSREPVAAVPAEEGLALLDVDGVQVGRVAEAPEGIPVVSVPLEDPDARALRAVLAVLQLLPEELAAEVVELSAESQDTVRLVLADGARVEWGSAEQTTLKATVLATLREAEVTEGVTVFDVSAPELPITSS